MSNIVWVIVLVPSEDHELGRLEETSVADGEFLLKKYWKVFY